MAIMAILWSVSTSIMAFAHSYWLLVVSRILYAMTMSACTPCAVSLITDYFPHE